MHAASSDFLGSRRGWLITLTSIRTYSVYCMRIISTFSQVKVVNRPWCKGQNWRAPTGIKTFHRASHPTAMDSQSDKASSQASSSSGMSFSGFSFQKKVSQSRVKLEAGAGLGGGGGDGGRARGRAVDEGKDYVLSLEGRTIHRLVG